ncbi:MAG: hypothetical protein ABMA25_02520 [Ilumatobacteraceae bacterium]
MSSNQTPTDPRARATEHFRIAATHVEAVFDAHDQLRDLLARHSAACQDDPVAGAEQLLASTGTISASLNALRSAVAAATAYRSARELARDLGTQAKLLTADPQLPTSPAGGATRALPAPTTALEGVDR